MAFTAKFTKDGTILFPEIVGYRISARFTPSQGFGGRFYITLIEKVAAGTDLASITMSANADDFRGTLQMDD